MLLPLNHWRVHRAETQAGIENALRRDVDGSGVTVGTLKAPGDVTLACTVLTHTHTHIYTHLNLGFNFFLLISAGFVLDLIGCRPHSSELMHLMFLSETKIVC